MKFYTMKDICEMLGIQEATVRKWMKEGQLKYIQLFPNKGVRISEEHLQEFLQSRVIN